MDYDFHYYPMYAIYGITCTINIPQMLAYIPYMDPMGYCIIHQPKKTSDTLAKLPHSNSHHFSDVVTWCRWNISADTST